MDFLNIIWIFLISLGINYLFFIFAFIFKSDVFTDITYALSFSLISIIFFAWYRNFSLNQILVFVLINIWALRLGTYLFARIIKIKVDHRFDEMRDSFWKFGVFWTLQAFTVFITVLPGTMFLTFDANSLNNNLTSLFSLFLLISLFGLTFETIADLQKNKFFNNLKTQKDSFLKTGLWKITRHPNYFGEMLVWYGIALTFISSVIFNSENLLNYSLILFLICPLYMNISLIYISGIFLLEIREFERYWNEEGYQDYLKTTPMIIPFIGKKGILSTMKKNPKFQLKD